jgi:hypothetical protein
LTILQYNICIKVLSQTFNMRVSFLTLAGSAAAQTLQMAAGQSAQLLALNPGGAVPANVQAPSISGFMEPTIQPSRGGLAVCVSGMVTQAFVSVVTSGSPFTEELMAGMQFINGTYNISATYCTPANNTKPDTVEVLTHGVGFDRYA